MSRLHTIQTHYLGFVVNIMILWFHFRGSDIIDVQYIRISQSSKNGELFDQSIIRQCMGVILIKVNRKYIISK